MPKKLGEEEYIKNGYASMRKRALSEIIEIHRHDFFELEYYASGSGYQIIDGAVVPITPGTLFLFTPTNIHSIKPDNCFVYNVRFNIMSLAASIITQLMTSPDTHIYNFPEEERPYIEFLLEDLYKNIDNVDLSCSFLNCIIAKLPKAPYSKSSVPADTDITRALLYILTNFKSNVNLDDVAAYIHKSPTYFSHYFKDHMSTSFKEYLDSLRFSYAKKLLIYSDESIQNVCTESGFNNLPNFLRRFKKRFGVSPKQYRIQKNILKKNK